MSADRHVVALPAYVVGHVYSFWPRGFRRTCKELNRVPFQVLGRWMHLVMQADLCRILEAYTRFALDGPESHWQGYEDELDDIKTQILVKAGYEAFLFISAG